MSGNGLYQFVLCNVCNLHMTTHSSTDMPQKVSLEYRRACLFPFFSVPSLTVVGWFISYIVFGESPIPFFAAVDGGVGIALIFFFPTALGAYYVRKRTPNAKKGIWLSRMILLTPCLLLLALSMAIAIQMNSENVGSPKFISFHILAYLASVLIYMRSDKKRG